VSPLVVTLGAFVIAAILGIVAAAGRKYRVSTPKTLAAMLTTHWMDHEVDARNFASIQHVKTITSLRKGNNRKEKIVFTGTLFQIIGLAALSVAMFLILRTAT
jgi:CTP:molybdopterin cytidylyltransferase MocA